MSIHMLSIESNYGGMVRCIHPVVLKDETHTILVDCAYHGFLEPLETQLRAEGIAPEALTHVILTHHDHDHMGTLYELKEKYPQIQVIAGENEVPYVTGELKPLRLVQAEALMASATEEQRAFGESFARMVNRVKPVSVDRAVKDNDRFEWCGGVQIIATPGHTPGHIAVYVEAEKTIICGDAAVVEMDQIMLANPEFASDLAMAKASLEKIKGLGAKTYMCYHGGSLTVVD